MNIFHDNLISSQEMIWNQQHLVRGDKGKEGHNLMFVPNHSAVRLNDLIPSESDIIEIGCANGRDARFFSSCGHRVTALDFSKIALDQMMHIAEKQKCNDLINPILWDINNGLPILPPNLFNCFYARSSLHLNDQKLLSLVNSLNRSIKYDGVIVIEGKGEEDISVKESAWFDSNLVVNWKEGGHIRRVWSEKFFTELAQIFSWDIVSLQEVKDNLFEKYFLRLIAKKKLH